MYLLYLDPPRELADITPDTLDGAPGSCWRVSDFDQAQAEAWLAEMLASGYRRGHERASRF